MNNAILTWYYEFHIVYYGNKDTFSNKKFVFKKRIYFLRNYVAFCYMFYDREKYIGSFGIFDMPIDKICFLSVLAIIVYIRILETDDLKL